MVETSFVDFLIQYGKEGIFFILFVTLYYKQQKDSVAREQRLEQQLEKSSEQLSKAIEALQQVKEINEKIDKLSERLVK